MLNSISRFLWIKIKIKGKGFIPFPLAFPLFVVQEMLDDVLDFTSVLSGISPKTTTHTYGIHSINDIILSASSIFRALTNCEPFDLIDVETEDVEVYIKLK